MTESTTALSRPLVVGHKRDGRSCYDPEAKRELVEACLHPGVSVTRMALAHGINANLLRKWIDSYRGGRGCAVMAQPPMLPAFVPVVPMAPSKSGDLAIGMILPNGIKLELNGMDTDSLPHLLNCLAGLPCSVSPRG